MSNFPTVSGKELVRALEKAGFVVLRIKGSHHFLQHIDSRTTVIPVHGNEDIGPGLLSKILRECDMTKEELRVYL